MRVLHVRNVHEALPRALALLDAEGVERPSRNGPVLYGPSVATVYARPLERVIFHAARDANPFFHLYESLWMLAGRDDVAGVLKYAANMANYSDDGATFHGAYGYRWRFTFGVDQLQKIASRLRADPTDRRCVLQMWETRHDLGGTGKDVPCNLTATFQRGVEGELNLTVFCRSNDIVWGAYGANAVHFSILLEYLALWIGCPVGTYTQISINWHGYLDTLKKVETVRPDRVGFIENPYIDRRVYAEPMAFPVANTLNAVELLDEMIRKILFFADTDKLTTEYSQVLRLYPWAHEIWVVLAAHETYRAASGGFRYLNALTVLQGGNPQNDWNVAAREWIERRYATWKAKQ